jgi:hypothetical protein
MCNRLPKDIQHVERIGKIEIFLLSQLNHSDVCSFHYILLCLNTKNQSWNLR